MTKAYDVIDKKTGRFIRQYELHTKTCKCGKSFQVAEWRIKSGRGKFCSKPCAYKYRVVKSGGEHHFWNNKPKYSALHKWVAKHYGQEMKCEWCGLESENPYQIHWANLSGEYKRNREDWLRLCAKCHYHYDRKSA